MKRRHLVSLLGVSAVSSRMPALAADAPPPVGELKSLGNDRFQIGRIVVDKRAGSFVVPAVVHALDKPLEYLATSRGGKKSYEALLELDVSGSEFNVACILVGLERDPELPLWKPYFHSQRPAQPVRLSVAWTDAGKRVQVTAAEALLPAEARARAAAVEWLYTGSFTSTDGSQYAADKTGNLISFIKDPTAVIEASAGVAWGPYGAVRGNALLPPEGSAVELVVEAVKGLK